MNYIERLNKLKNNLDGLENKSKDELIEFVTLIINMGIAREEGNRYADELTEIVHKSEENEWAGNLYDQLEFRDATGYGIDDFIEKLQNGELKIVKGE